MFIEQTAFQVNARYTLGNDCFRKKCTQSSKSKHVRCGIYGRVRKLWGRVHANHRLEILARN